MTDGVAPAANRAGDGRWVVIAALGLIQILAWGSSYYLLAVLAPVIAADTGWPLSWIVGGLALGMVAAGLVSPLVGRRIDRHGGRPVLATSALLFAVGLGGLALSQSLVGYLGAWLVLGLAMGAGLYDAAFATLGRLYGQSARQAIAALTLFGGLASTACWPLSAQLVATVGWRGTCLAYAGLHLVVALPLCLLLIPAATRRIGRTPERTSGADPPRPPADRVSEPMLPLLAATIALGSAVSALLSVHLLTILQGGGLSLGAAVALGALVGPAQVGARAIEMAIGRYHHPVWTMVAAVWLAAAGLLLLWSGLPIPALALVLYGAGIGIESIARGTVPLALFGARDYPRVMGRLALPSLLAQAAAPVGGAILLQYLGADQTLTVMLGVALLDGALVLALVAQWRSACLRPSAET